VHHVITDKAYADGLKTSIDNKGNKALRNAPTLINAVFQKSFFLDGRSQTLTEQISEVLIRTSLMEIHQFSDKILTDTLIQMFKMYLVMFQVKTRKSLELFHPIFDLEGMNRDLIKILEVRKIILLHLRKMESIYLWEKLCVQPVILCL
jgi:hypothetical protein